MAKSFNMSKYPNAAELYKAKAEHFEKLYMEASKIITLAERIIRKAKIFNIDWHNYILSK